MIREEYSIRLIRWWSIAEKSRRAAFVKKDGERNVSWVHWNGNTLAICRNTGKSFHRFPSSIRSEWHRNPVGLTPFSPDRTCLYLSLSLHSNGAEKHTREKGWQSFRGKFSSKWNIPLSLSILQSYPVGGIDISLPRSFLCIKFESWWQISFRKVFSKTEKSARILCKLNRVAFHVTRYINTRREGSMTPSTPSISAEWDPGRIDRPIIETILSANSYAMKMYAREWGNDETFIGIKRIFYFAAS